MHRVIALIFSLLAPVSAWSLSCPNNGSILKFNDSIQEVSERCGQPTSSHNYTHTTIISAEWVYYITNPLNNTNTKVTILFRNGQVTNINIIMSGENQQNVKSSSICRMPIQTGSSMNYIRSVCGNPVSQNTLQTTSTQMTELKYDTNKPNILIFENGSLKGWK